MGSKRTRADIGFETGYCEEQKAKRAHKCKAARKIVGKFGDIQHARYEQLRLLIEESNRITPSNLERQNLTAQTPVLKKPSSYL